MKFIPLILAGMLRKRARAVLMLLQMASAFLLFGLLQGFNGALKVAISQTHADRLYVASSVTVGDPLPLSMLPEIEATPGVEVVALRHAFGGFYQQPNQGIGGVAVVPEKFFDVYQDDIIVPKEQVQALKNTRTGAIIGISSMEKYKLKIGDRITIKNRMKKQDGTTDWTFDIVGSYHNGPNNAGDAGAIFINYDYMNEARTAQRDTVIMYALRINNAAKATEIGLAIDDKFANSPHGTHTQTESDLVQGQIQRIGDIDFIVNGVVAAVFFALLLATSALMMQSVRERVPELAILKTLGFSDERVMGIIIVEAVVFCLIAAAVGLWLSSVILPMARQQLGFNAKIPLYIVLAGFGFAALLALIGSAVPAWRGLRLKVVDALADV
jgi:putative ABC transport system permease protein